MEAENTISEVEATTGVTKDEKTSCIVAYALYALGFITAITFIAGVIWAYVKRGEAQSEVAKDQYRWIIRTFWFSVLWSVIGAVLSVVVVGYFILLANAIWVIYRIIVGYTSLTAGKKRYA
jgi:uncharacterized membrane protein